MARVGQRLLGISWGSGCMARVGAEVAREFLGLWLYGQGRAEVAREFLGLWLCGQGWDRGCQGILGSCGCKVRVGAEVAGAFLVAVIVWLGLGQRLLGNSWRLWLYGQGWGRGCQGIHGALVVWLGWDRGCQGILGAVVARLGQGIRDNHSKFRGSSVSVEAATLNLSDNQCHRQGKGRTTHVTEGGSIGQPTLQAGVVSDNPYHGGSSTRQHVTGGGSIRQRVTGRESVMSYNQCHGQEKYINKFRNSGLR